MRRTLVWMSALSALAFLTAPAAAQQSTTRGFNLGLHLQGSSMEIEGERHSAGGGGLWFGYGFNRTVQLFVQLDAAEFDVNDAEVEGQWVMAHADLGARFHFANSLRSWVPYLQVAATGRVVGVEDAVVLGNPETDVSFLGGALTLGGGVIFYFNESLGLDLQLLWSGGDFTEVEAGNVTVQLPDPIEAQSSRFNIGLSWWP